MVNRANQACRLLGASPSTSTSQMLREARREVPSLVLGPPSPSWMEPIVGSPPGSLKDSHEFWTTLPTPAEVPQSSRARDLHHASATASQSEISSASRASTYPEATTASCEFRKRSASPSCEISKTKTRTKPSSAKRRRIVPSGDETPAATPVEDTWSTALSADTLSDTFLAPSSDMERDATEQFMNEFWGDLLLDASPASDDDALPALSDETPLPALPDCHLLDDVTEDQLLELAEFLGPELPQTTDLELEPTAEPAAAPEPIEMLPMPHLPEPVTPEAPAPPTIDLAALLEETEIVFCPELETPAVTSPSAPTPTPVPVTVAGAGATHYLLVVSPPERETATPATALSVASVTSDSLDDAGFHTDGDDPEFLLDDQSTRWSSMSTEAEGEVYSVPSSGSSRKRAPRRPPAATPAEKYRRIRDNNNEASRRSRQQRKQREVDAQARAEELESENARLHQKVTVLEGLLEQVKALAPLLTAKR